ncbi:MAG: hypothetical protein QOD83_2508 [Solirubrobacteraceae bacterium]|nr:hypothetical protein [Solirubrobacteraceae bacterium]
MRASVPAAQPIGTNLGRVRPTLEVLTGYGDDPRRTLLPDHQLYELALIAWNYQDTWPFEMWHDFWAFLLPRWPHPDGVPRMPVEHLERVVATLRREGFTFASIEQAIEGYQPDSLRRRGIRSGATEFAETYGRHRLQAAPGEERFIMRLEFADGEMRAYPLVAEAVLPRVYSVEAGEAQPPRSGYNLLRLTREQAGARPEPPSIREIGEQALRTLRGAV